MNLTPVMRAALHYIRVHGSSIEMGSSVYSLGTIKALEKRGFVQTHSGGAYIGTLGHYLTDDGKIEADRIARENRATFRRFKSTVERGK